MAKATVDNTGAVTFEGNPVGTGGVPAAGAAAVDLSNVASNKFLNKGIAAGLAQDDLSNALMRSPDGTHWGLTVNNDGSFTLTPQ